MTNRKKTTFTRRQAMQTTAAAGMGFWMGSQASTSRADESPNEKMNVAVIGIGGRGRANLGGVKEQNVVALCDVDDERAGKSYEKFPKAKKYYDFRKMLSEMESEIDAVVVSTPDHTHFHPSMMALAMGKALYCEKPMAHNVWEVRQMTNLARERDLATQLGVQRHAIPNMARVAELVQAGAIGTVTQVICHLGKTRGMPKVPTGAQPVPDHLKWDLWLGPTKERAYHRAYCPYDWRFWWDYGTGESGNWGCHILDIPYRALRLGHCSRVTASGPPVHEFTTPETMDVTFEFAPAGDRPAVALRWVQSRKAPKVMRGLVENQSGYNTLFIGTEGMLLCGFKKLKLLPEDKFTDYQPPEPSTPKSPGFYREWFNACRGERAATCYFDYSGPLTETVLLGNVAYRAGAFDWDAARLKAIGNADAQNLIQEEYRKGWEISTLG